MTTQDIVREYAISFYAKKRDLFTRALRENAKPPIKGEITKGKLRWRGIRQVHDSQTGEVWLSQRGTPISDKIKFEFKP